MELEIKKRTFIQAENEVMISGVNMKTMNLKAKINVLLDKEAQMWSQRSHVLWLQMGIITPNFFIVVR